MKDQSHTRAGVLGFIGLRNAVNIARWRLQFATNGGHDLKDLRNDRQLAGARLLIWKRRRVKGAVRKIIRLKNAVANFNDRRRDPELVRRQAE